MLLWKAVGGASNGQVAVSALGSGRASLFQPKAPSMPNPVRPNGAACKSSCWEGVAPDPDARIPQQSPERQYSKRTQGRAEFCLRGGGGSKGGGWVGLWGDPPPQETLSCERRRRRRGNFLA